MINVGDKFVVEIDKVFEQDGEKLFRAKGFKSLVFDQKGLDKLKMFQDEYKVSIDCECGMSFSIGSYDYQETYRAWNRRAGEEDKHETD